MKSRPLSPAGLSLLDRRRFLSHMAGGMGGIALSYLLANEGLLASPDQRPAHGSQPVGVGNPLAPKKPHFTASAKRVIHIFCTGAVSHRFTYRGIHRHCVYFPTARITSSWSSSSKKWRMSRSMTQS